MAFCGFASKMDDHTAECVSAIGTATRLMARSQKYSKYPIACISEWIVPAIMLKQIKFYFSAAEKPIGYVTWGYFAPDVEERWVEDPLVRLHISEWNECGALWIMDMVALDGYFPYMARDVMTNLFPEESVFRFVKRDGERGARRVCQWPRRRLLKRFERFRDVYEFSN